MENWWVTDWIQLLAEVADIRREMDELSWVSTALSMENLDVCSRQDEVCAAFR